MIRCFHISPTTIICTIEIFACACLHLIILCVVCRSIVCFPLFGLHTHSCKFKLLQLNSEFTKGFCLLLKTKCWSVIGCIYSVAFDIFLESCLTGNHIIFYLNQFTYNLNESIEYVNKLILTGYPHNNIFWNPYTL